jgi:transcriptional regulator with XRE-family HTH domain
MKKTTFGTHLRAIRKARKLSQRALAEMVGVNFTYLSKIETGNLDFAGVPARKTIRAIAKALGEDEEKLLVMAGKIPERLRRRILQRPDDFMRLSRLDDAQFDRVMKRLRK